MPLPGTPADCASETMATVAAGWSQETFILVVPWELRQFGRILLTQTLVQIGQWEPRVQVDDEGILNTPLPTDGVREIQTVIIFTMLSVL